MQQTEFGPAGAYIRWTEAAGDGPARVHIHGLGAASGPYTAHLSADPRLAGRRTLFVDLPGFGISDRPADFGYSLEEHAAAVAAVLDAAGVRGAEVVGHSMGGAVAIVLAYRRPELVERLVLAEANLDPDPPLTADSSAIATWTEEEFVDGGGFAATLERAGWRWAATMRCADPLALHRSATGLVRGTEGSAAGPLLLRGGAIWLINVVIFALAYWELDRGGPAARAAGERDVPDFLFVQMQSPDLAPPHWEPVFFDYLYLSFTNSTAFSPTDVMPSSLWAKALMMGQSAVSLLTVVLVVARAVNILG
ncbi:alpha/beta fold hydrolase [Actinacidiphila rubida]|uniref:alpha/beta fold hydrolase n=1 Tax=Actinacidiphila rubida TaxID=310780 RepID=UPI00099FB72D|nr:alpha/beta hydrolase [Actinacidiphila rubida]